MNPASIAVWDELLPASGDVLIIVNSPESDTTAVESLFDAVARVAGERSIWVIAEPNWSSWLAARQIPDGQILWSVDQSGQRLELLHFLETSRAVLWTAARHFRFIAGTTPHSLYNDQVQLLFEERVAMLCGDARLLTHSLPQGFVFLFDHVEILERLARDRRLIEYRRVSTAIVEDLYQQWLIQGRPAPDDEASVATAVLRRNLPLLWLRYDESGPPVISRRQLPELVVKAHRRVSDLLRVHDDESHRRAESAEQQRDALSGELERYKEFLRSVQQERTEAVELRDRMLDELRITSGDAAVVPEVAEEVDASR